MTTCTTLTEEERWTRRRAESCLWLKTVYKRAREGQCGIWVDVDGCSSSSVNGATDEAETPCSASSATESIPSSSPSTPCSGQSKMETVSKLKNLYKSISKQSMVEDYIQKMNQQMEAAAAGTTAPTPCELHDDPRIVNSVNLSLLLQDAQWRL